MGMLDNDLNEAMKYVCDVIQKKIDEAYNDGKKYGLDESDMREAVSYQKGLDDAWDAARKIMFDEGGIDMNTLCTIFKRGCSESIIRDFSASEAVAKLKAYEEKYKADEKIKVGDEVESLYDDRTVIENTIPWVVTWIREGYNGKKSYYGIDAEGTLRNNDFVRKTGRRFGIDKILEEMKQSNGSDY